MSTFDDELNLVLQQRLADQRYRQRHCLASPQDTHVVVGGERYLAFCSNDYLGLANHPQVVACFQQAAGTHGVGSGAAHLVYGHSQYHHQLEQALAAFTGRERVLLFSTGYMANLGIISALTQRNDTIYQDRLNHASLIDAGLLSRAKVKRYRHNDVEQLEQLLQQDNSRRKFVVVDGVFSMDGDIAPLSDLAALCQQYQAQLMVDDAHGFGVLGEHGGGCAEHCSLTPNELPILMGTLGKAFGTFGAFVAGSEALIETLNQFARPYIYTTALPPAVAAATIESLSLLQADTWRREKLRQNITLFRHRATELGLPLMASSTAIQPLVLGDDKIVLQLAQQLREQCILVGAIRPPTVPEGTSRLRITLSANHELQDIERLLQALADLVPPSLRQSGQ